MASEKTSDPDLQIEPVEQHSQLRVHYARDLERGDRQLRGRRQSSDSLSLTRSISRNRNLPPDVVLPTQFRTISIGIEEAKTRIIKEELKNETDKLEFSDTDWHLVNDEELFQRLSSSPNQGLSKEQSTRKLKEYGRNVFSAPPSQWFVKTLKYLFGGFGTVLFIASILVFIAWRPLGNPPAVANLALAIVLAIVWVIQASFSFYQDWSSSRVMASISNMIPEECMVFRDGTLMPIIGSEIVPGDILHIKLGSKLPADVRFTEVSADAKFDRSILTGETIPIRGTTTATDSNFLETANIGMAGTHCVSGNAYGIVIATGDRSVFGRLAKLTSTPKKGLTNLEKEIYLFVAVIVSVMLAMVLIVIGVWAGWTRQVHPDFISVPNLIVACVSVAVAFIPEGLPIAVTSSLTITANVMRKNNILCKSLKTVETLGSVNVVCSDKTGTLTKNKMTVTDCLVDRQALTATGAAGLAPDTTLGLHSLARVGAICNDGSFDAASAHEPLEERKIHGDATDQAILRFSESLVPVADNRAQWKTLYSVPFNSKSKFMIRVIEATSEQSKGEKMLMIKGAPDVLLPRCRDYLSTNGVMEPINDEYQQFIDNTKNKWSREAKRVILLAQVKLDGNIPTDTQSREYELYVMNKAAGNLGIVGLVALADPPRDEIPEVVRTLRRAGIKIHMVTGDFKLTAQAIAANCGIITQTPDRVDDVNALSRTNSIKSISMTMDSWPGTQTPPVTKSIVLSGSDLMDLEEHQWDNLCNYDEIVFARTTPEQKLRIVKQFQARKHIVAMTGDGVNDAPSLKEADVGVAMGGGSDVALEAADMVLLDSFVAIVEAVKYGRVVFDNLKKTIFYLLPAGSFSEFWPIMTNVLFGLPQILSSFLMIIICCFTDCAAAIAIAYEKPEADVLLQKPRNPRKDRLVNWKLIFNSYGIVGTMETLSSFAMSYWFLQRNGVPFSLLWFGFGATPEGMDSDTYTSLLNQASSIYFVNLVVMQWFNLMAVRTRRLSLLQHPPLFRRETQNIFLFPAIVFALLIAIFFMYVPRFQIDLGTSSAPVAHWFLPMAFGMAIFLVDEARKYFVRKYPTGFLAKIAW